MAIEEDFSIFFDTDGFAVPFTFTPQVGTPETAVGIFDDAYSAATGGEVTVASTQPQLIYETATLDVTPIYGDAITVNGTAYTVVGIQPDGTGTTTLMLELDS